MQLILTLLTIVLIADIASATTPIIEPFPDAFARFEKTYPQQCAEVLKEVQSNLKRTGHRNIEAKLEGMVQYVSNLGYGTADVRRALTEKNPRMPLEEAVFRLVTDIVGFRRCLDVVIIEGVASGTLSPSDSFMKKVRAIWDDEYYYSWLFRSEFYPGREKPQKPNKAPEPTRGLP